MLKTLIGLGENEERQGNLIKAREFYKEANLLSEDLKDLKKQAIIYLKLSHLGKDLGKDDPQNITLDYEKKASEIFKVLGIIEPSIDVPVRFNA